MTVTEMNYDWTTYLAVICYSKEAWLKALRTYPSFFKKLVIKEW